MRRITLKDAKEALIQNVKDTPFASEAHVIAKCKTIKQLYDYYKEGGWEALYIFETLISDPRGTKRKTKYIRSRHNTLIIPRTR